MLLCWFALAHAAEPPPPTVLPLRVADDDLWASRALGAIRTERTGLWIAVGGGASLALGAGLLLTEDDRLIPLGATFTAAGVVGAAVGPPMLLGGGMRSNRSMRARGVYASNAAGVGAWTLFAVSPLLIPLGAVAPELIPVWYGGVLALGEVQVDVNRRARARAGMDFAPQPGITLVPTRHGLAIAGAF